MCVKSTSRGMLNTASNEGLDTGSIQRYLDPSASARPSTAPYWPETIRRHRPHNVTERGRPSLFTVKFN